MDESSVLIMMLLDLPMSDILFLSAKGKGGYDNGGGLAGGLSRTSIWPSFVSPDMQRCFDTNEEWQSMVKYELALYKAANASIDLTIDKLGPERFETNLAKFRHTQAVLQEKCLLTTIFPCDSGDRVRQDTDCLWKDSGCGVKCLDKIANELGVRVRVSIDPRISTGISVVVVTWISDFTSSNQSIPLKESLKLPIKADLCDAKFADWTFSL